jgi:hypothetical protein
MEDDDGFVERSWKGACTKAEGCVLSNGHVGTCELGKFAETEYEMEAIIAQRTKRGRGRPSACPVYEYLVKWVGWPEEDATWEGMRCFAGHCRPTLDDWVQKQATPEREAVPQVTATALSDDEAETVRVVALSMEQLASAEAEGGGEEQGGTDGADEAEVITADDSSPIPSPSPSHSPAPSALPPSDSDSDSTSSSGSSASHSASPDPSPGFAPCLKRDAAHLHSSEPKAARHKAVTWDAESTALAPSREKTQRRDRSRTDARRRESWRWSAACLPSQGVS